MVEALRELSRQIELMGFCPSRSVEVRFSDELMAELWKRAAFANNVVEHKGQDQIFAIPIKTKEVK